MRETDILIVGAGPAGAATALELVRTNSEWADRITILDKAKFPRKKICGGGLTPYALQWLNNYFNERWPPGDLMVQSIKEAQIRYGNSLFAYFDDPVLQIVERKNFDNWLLEKVLESGVEVLLEEEVNHIHTGEDGVEIHTNNKVWKASIVVGADGANSLVRQRLGLHAIDKMARLLEIITTSTKGNPYHKNQRAIFDFTPMKDGLQGYYWDFPAVTGGQMVMNSGVFDSGVHDKKGIYSLKHLFKKNLNGYNNGLDHSNIEGHPIYRFHPEYRPYCYRVLLVGDAAGSDPFLGEGIAFALHYGSAAAEAINKAIKQNDFGLKCYDRVIRKHHVLSQLWTRYNIARLGYGINSRLLLKLVWSAAPWIMGWQASRKPSLVPLSNKRMYRL